MKKDDLIGAKEKEADIYFSDGLKNEQSCEAGRKSAIAQVRETLSASNCTSERI